MTKKVATVRLDDSLYGEIKRLAHVEHRSLNSEIVQLITEAIECRRTNIVFTGKFTEDTSTYILGEEHE